MSIPRVIPCLLLQDGALVKTVRFAQPRYVGDPVNVLSIFSSFQVDEIVLLDIGAARSRAGPPLAMLQHLADECLIPLAYGGGISDVGDVGRILEIGFEKVVLNTTAAARPEVVAEAAETFGSQAVVVSIDAAQVGDTWETRTAGGGAVAPGTPAARAAEAATQGAGEILITSIDRDGTMEGYDLDLVRSVTAAVDVPVIACGGAGRRPHLADPVREAGASAVAAGSLFVFQRRDRGVLINYPSRSQLQAIFDQGPA